MENLPGLALDEHHQQYLAARAVNLDLAAQLGLRSVDAVTGGQLLSRARALPSGGLAIAEQLQQ